MSQDGFRHCDDYINDPEAPECLRRFLARARSPAHGHTSSVPFPTLFATYNHDQEWLGFVKGDRVRVVMASRLGDVGVTKNLDAASAYGARFSVDRLTNFSEEP